MTQKVPTREEALALLKKYNQNESQIKHALAVEGVMRYFARKRGEDGAPTAEAFRQLNDAPRALTLEVGPAGERRKIPTGFEQAIPGTMVMFTLIVLLSSRYSTAPPPRNGS